MVIARAKDGNPSTRFYENPEIIATFDPVRMWLTRNHKKYTQTEPPTNKSLATLCFQLLQFQEANFTSSSRSFIRIPFKCFMDFKPGGGLCHIFLTCFKFRHENNWKKIDLSSSSRTDKHMEMFSVIERELIAYKCMERPVVYISPTVEKNLNSRLRECAKRLNVSVVESASEATHILHPPPSNWSGDSRDDFQVQRFRVMFHEGRGVLLHWLYSPASHTTWYTGLQFEWSPETESPFQLENVRPWEVDARWLLYSDEAYEWMIEEDFLVSGSVKPRQTYSPDEFMALNSAAAVNSSSSSSQFSSSFTPSSHPDNSGSKKKRRRSPSPSASDLYQPNVSGKKRRPGSSITGSHERSNRGPSGHGSSRKIRKEDEDESSCHTGPQDPNKDDTNDTDITKDFDDPEPPNKVTPITTTPAANGSGFNASRPTRTGNNNSNTNTLHSGGGGGGGGDLGTGRSLFDLDEDNDTGDGVDGGGMNEYHAGMSGVGDLGPGGTSNQGDEGSRQGGIHTDLSVTEQAHCIVIPSYSAWFDYNAIHGIERRALPEFFNGQNKSKTPEVYLAYRNFMVDTYRLNPQEYLTFTACRRNLTGDVCSILRVHAFLEQWGLINYQVTAPLTTSTSGSGTLGVSGGATEAARLAVAASLGPPSTAHFHILADSASGLQPIGNQNVVATSTIVSTSGGGATTTTTLTDGGQSAVKDNSTNNNGNVAAATSITSTNNEVITVSTSSTKPESQGNEFTGTSVTISSASTTTSTEAVNTALPTVSAATTTTAINNSSATNITANNNINNTQVGVNKLPTIGDPALRTDQYLANASINKATGGLLDNRSQSATTTTATSDTVPPPTSQATVVNTKLLKGATQSGWTDQETLLLLEALELYRDDWNKVAEHVGSRTQEECILHFLRLPIEDAYLEGTDPILNLTSLANASHPTPPFSKTVNPILSTVAFLAAAVDPRVAAAAAQAALTEYAKMRDEVPAGLLREHKARVEAAVKLGHPVDPQKFGLDEVGGSKVNEELEKPCPLPSVVPNEKSMEQVISVENEAKEIEHKESTPMDITSSSAVDELTTENKSKSPEAASFIPKPEECKMDTVECQEATDVNKAEPMIIEEQEAKGETDEATGVTQTKPGEQQQQTVESLPHLVEQQTEPVVSEATTAIDASATTSAAATSVVQESEKSSADQQQQPQSQSQLAEPSEKTAATNSLPPNPDSLGTAAACALAAAAIKARHLASVEEKRIKGLVAQLVETQLKKLDIKLKQIQELESIMEREYEMIEQMRQQLLQERQAFHMEVIKTMENRARSLVHHHQQQQQQQQQQPQGVGGGVVVPQQQQPPAPLPSQPLQPQPQPQLQQPPPQQQHPLPSAYATPQGNTYPVNQITHINQVQPQPPLPQQPQHQQQLQPGTHIIQQQQQQQPQQIPPSYPPQIPSIPNDPRLMLNNPTAPGNLSVYPPPAPQPPPQSYPSTVQPPPLQQQQQQPLAPSLSSSSSSLPSPNQQPPSVGHTSPTPTQLIQHHPREECQQTTSQSLPLQASSTMPNTASNNNPPQMDTTSEVVWSSSVYPPTTMTTAAPPPATATTTTQPSMEPHTVRQFIEQPSRDNPMVPVPNITLTISQNVIHPSADTVTAASTTTTTNTSVLANSLCAKPSPLSSTQSISSAAAAAVPGVVVVGSGDGCSEAVAATAAGGFQSTEHHHHQEQQQQPQQHQVSSIEVNSCTVASLLSDDNNNANIEVPEASGAPATAAAATTTTAEGSGSPSVPDNNPSIAPPSQTQTQPELSGSTKEEGNIHQAE
ncbi:unnamed protein product [Trichobilharzia szidati]|nr:unnamed protein product [Trichobilharzia szidati]